MYEYGKLDMAEVYKNRFEKIYDGLIAQLNSVQFGITTGIAMLKQISYKVPKGWTKPTRTRKTIEIDTADGFYENKQTTGDQFKTLSEESTQNKIGLLQSILTKITKTKDEVTKQKESLKKEITSKGDDFDALVNKLTEASSFELKHKDKEITSTKDLPLLTKVKGVGYVIQNDNLSMLFAEYSGYVRDSASVGGSSISSISSSSNSSNSSNSKMDVEDNKPNDEHQGIKELGLEECIYLKKAYKNLNPNENNMDENNMDENDFGVALSIEYANVVKDALDEEKTDITYPNLLLEYGGYKMGDEGTEVFMDEETANKIVNEMNDKASKYLHIANDNHKKEIIILLDEYLARLDSLTERYNWRTVSTRKRKMDSNSSNLDTSTQDDTPLCIPDGNCVAPNIIKIDGKCISINNIMKTTTNVVSTTIQDIRDKEEFKPNDFVLYSFYYTKGTKTEAIKDAATIRKISNCFMSFTRDFKDPGSIITTNSSDSSIPKKPRTNSYTSQGGKARKLTKKKQKKNQKQRTRRKRKTRRKNMRKTIKKRNGKNNK